MLFGKTLKRFAMGFNFAGGFAASDSPSMRGAHHNSLKHGLAADKSFLSAFKCRQKLNGYEETPPGFEETHDD